MSQVMHKLLRDILETTGGDHRRLVAAAQFARPANVTAYAIGQLVANNTVAGNVVPLQFAVARNARAATPVDPTTGVQAIFSGVVRRVRIAKNGVAVANASFRLHLYSVLPVPANGDGGAWSTSQAATYLGFVDVTIDKAMTDGSVGHGGVSIAATQFAVPIDLIKARANDRVRELAAELLPNGREDCGYWRTGSIADEPGQSLAVTLQRARQGHVVRPCDRRGRQFIQLAQRHRLPRRCRRGDRLAEIEARARRPRSRAAAHGARRSAEAPGRGRAQRADAEEEAKRRNALGLFLHAKPIPGTPVELYLRTRGIDLARLGRAPRASASIPSSIAPRPGAGCRRWSRRSSTSTGGTSPRTAPGWRRTARAAGPRPTSRSRRRSWARSRAAASGCGRARAATLAELEPGSDVWASEGIEDGLSAAIAKPEIRVVAGVTLGNLGEIQLPEQLGRLIIIGQRDTNPKTLDALERAVGRQQERGHEVWLTPPPAGGFKDVNEALMKEIAA
jgi:hypothetical protein